MAKPSGKISAVPAASEYENRHENGHRRPYYPSPPANDEMQIPRRHGRSYYPPPPPPPPADEVQIPGRHGRPITLPYYPSPAAADSGNTTDETMQTSRRHYSSEPAAKVDPRRHGRPSTSKLQLQPQEQPSDDDHDSESDYQQKLPPSMNNGHQIYPPKAAAANGTGNENGNGNGYMMKKKPGAAAAAVPVATSDESDLREKLLEIHAHDGTATFHTQPLLESIQGILDHLDATHRFPNSKLINNLTTLVDKYPATRQPARPPLSIDTLPYLLHKITCMLNCKCGGGGGDGHALALEILEVVANYTWDAKIVIVLAAFAVEFGQYGLVTTLYNDNNQLAKSLAFLRQTPNVVQVEAELEVEDEDEDAVDYVTIRSKMETIIRIARLSIEVTKVISMFDRFPSKHISPDVEPMLVALNQIPNSVYWMIRVVIACASEHSQILGHSQIINSYSETWGISMLETKMGEIWKTFTTQYELCHNYIEEKIEKQFCDKLEVMFSETTNYGDNQRIFQAIFNTKDYTPPFSKAGSDQLVGVDVLRRKTVLLLISDLSISLEEIEIISRSYRDSRRGSSSLYEIVWVPIVKLDQQMEAGEEEIFEGLKGLMPWYVVEKPNLLKSGFKCYIKKEETWNYSNKTIMVALDNRGKVVHLNALHMMITWGNAAYPFTYRHECYQWNITREWSLPLLLQDLDTNISSSIKEKKVICLFGGHDYYWISTFLALAKHVAEEASIELEIVYICKKVTTEEHITIVTEKIGGRSEIWSNSKSAQFWKRIESMKQSKLDPRVEGAGDRVLTELLYMSSLGESENGWAVISGGDGKGADRVTKATGDAIVNAFDRFGEWSDDVEKGFVPALADYLAKGNNGSHQCTEVLLTGGEDIPGIALVCSECGQPMERRVTFVCSATIVRSSVSG